MLKKYILSIFILVAYLNVNAQENRDLNQDVEVLSTYKPIIASAKRISTLPVIVDTLKFNPSFVYKIRTKPVAASFEPAPINAAKLVGEPLRSINSHRLILAAGNYASVFGDYRFNNYNWGLHLNHYSTNGKFKLENGTKQKPNWQDQAIEVYGSRYKKDNIISGELYYKRNSFNYYGSPQANTMPSNSLYIFDYAKQKFQNIGAKAEYKTLLDDDEINYSVNLLIDNFSDDHKVSENNIVLDLSAQTQRNELTWAVETDFEYFSTKGLLPSEAYNGKSKFNVFDWCFNPYMEYSEGVFDLHLGFTTHASLGDVKGFDIFPDIDVKLLLVDNILSMFLGADGNHTLNSYKAIANENPFIISGLKIAPTHQAINLYAGFLANLSSKAKLKIKANYTNIEDDYFFVKANYLQDPGASTPLGLQRSNKFRVVYDDITKMSLAAEFNLNLNDRLDINAEAVFNKYSMTNLEQAWHKPSFEFDLYSKYKFSHEFLFNASLKIVDKRKVMSKSSKELDAVVDLSFGAEYKINERLTAFANVNNLFSSRYYVWESYPNMGVNALLGLSLVF